VVRAALTAIDYNSNVGRMPAVDKDGEARYNVVNSRDGQVYVGICLYAGGGGGSPMCVYTAGYFKITHRTLHTLKKTA